MRGINGNYYSISRKNLGKIIFPKGTQIMCGKMNNNLRYKDEFFLWCSNGRIN